MQLIPTKSSFWVFRNRHAPVIGFDEKGYHQNCGCNPRASGHHHL